LIPEYYKIQEVAQLSPLMNSPSSLFNRWSRNVQRESWRGTQEDLLNLRQWFWLQIKSSQTNLEQREREDYLRRDQKRD